MQASSTVVTGGPGRPFEVLTAPRAELGFLGLQNNRLDQTGY